MNSSLSKFQSVTVFILTKDETNLLRKTISKITSSDNFINISKIIIVAKNAVCDGCAEALRIVEEDSSGKISLYIQKAPTIELCLYELPPLVEGSHFIIMAADMEMNPDDVSNLIDEAKINPDAIVCAAKWMKGSVVEGYNKIHEIGSRAINIFTGLIYGKNVKDPFSIYQIYPMSAYKSLNFRDPVLFGYEYTVKALRNGIPYKEIPTKYTKRTEGRSHVDIIKLVKMAMIFCFVAVKTRFSGKVLK